MLDRVLFKPKKFRDRDLDRIDLELLALLVLFLSSSSLSSYLALWILQMRNQSVSVSKVETGGQAPIRQKDLPTLTNHAHSLGLGHTVKLGSLLEVLFAANSLGIAEASLGKCVYVAPV